VAVDDPARRAALNLAKLKVLAGSVGAEGLTPLGFPGGAAAYSDGTLFVLGDGLRAAVLGPAIALALREGDTFRRLVVITDDAADATVMARRAAEFARPAKIDSAYVDGTALAFRVNAPAPDVREYARTPLVDVIEAAGADAVFEHGVLRAEVRGLEIARVEDGELAVGVGKHDREGHRMANPDADPAVALAALAERVRRERTADAPQGLMTTLARERWLRGIIVARPDLIGTPPLTPVEPPLPRADLRATAIAPAVGDGVVVACSVGVDPNLVPAAADVRVHHAPDADLLLVVPEADAVPPTYRLAVALRHPARVVTVPDNWAHLGD
jgi:hypothetical protein